MSIYPTHHWPPPEPPDIVLEGWIPLFEAFNLVGKAEFGDDWADGKELAARNRKEIPLKELRLHEARLKHSGNLNKLKDLPPVSEGSSGAAGLNTRYAPLFFFETRESEISAHERAD